MNREIVLDTETTGLNPLTGDRVVEVGCVELINHVPTGRNFHRYINPERSMPEEAFRVHGLSEAFLADKPRFAEIADELLEFLGDATLVAHNASFDMQFLNAELEAAKRPRLNNKVVDTVVVAREKHPGARVSLDALCKHYGVDLSRRTLHGALLDSEILADVYLELLGGRQVALALVDDPNRLTGDLLSRKPARQRPVPLPSRLDQAQIEAHLAFVRTLGDKAVWRRYLGDELDALDAK